MANDTEGPLDGSAHYTFGDNDLAALRLRLLAEAFAPPTRAFMDRLARQPARVAIDLGCGLGYTTALLRARTGAARTFGLDSSARFVAQARAAAPAGLVFARHDLTRVPFPTPPAELMYGRFIMTHLRDVGAVVDGWAQAAAPGGRLAVEETTAIESPDPLFRRYYALVEAMQRAQGQVMYIGQRLAALCAGPCWEVERADAAPLTVSGSAAARLHALNLRTFRGDAFVTSHLTPDALDQLQRDLDAVAWGARAAPDVQWTLAQVVLRRR